MSCDPVRVKGRISFAYHCDIMVTWPLHHIASLISTNHLCHIRSHGHLHHTCIMFTSHWSVTWTCKGKFQILDICCVNKLFIRREYGSQLLYFTESSGTLLFKPIMFWHVPHLFMMDPGGLLVYKLRLGEYVYSDDVMSLCVWGQTFTFEIGQNLQCVDIATFAHYWKYHPRSDFWIYFTE